MTLAELFQAIGSNPSLLIIYFLLIPITALLAGILGRGEGHLSPWKYVYSALIFAVSVPGIFAVGLSVYFFLFQRGDIMQMNVYTQLLPILVLFITVWLIRRNVSLNVLPGFDTLSGLWLMLFASMALLFILDRTRIFVVSYMPFSYLLIIFLVLFLLLYIGWRRFASK